MYALINIEPLWQAKERLQSQLQQEPCQTGAKHSNSRDGAASEALAASTEEADPRFTAPRGSASDPRPLINVATKLRSNYNDFATPFSPGLGPHASKVKKKHFLLSRCFPSRNQGQRCKNPLRRPEADGA
jgi:hypothetical protein